MNLGSLAESLLDEQASSIANAITHRLDTRDAPLNTTVNPTRLGWPPKAKIPPYAKMLTMRDGVNLETMAWDGQYYI